MEIEKRGENKDPNGSNSAQNGKLGDCAVVRASTDKTYRVFCEKHRPLKIVKEMEERDQATIEEIQRFCKILDKCMEIDERHQLKPVSIRLELRKEREKRERELERER
jgi:flagellar motility protein MotE (MotC chaperone)